MGNDIRIVRSSRLALPENEIVDAYRMGYSKFFLAKKYRVHERIIKEILIDHGVELRTHGAANKSRWDHITQEEVRSRALKHARTVQERVNLSSLEKRFMEIFLKSGIEVNPHYALDIFNLDFAIPKVKIAIEVDSRWHGYSNLVAKDERKESYLIKEGWTLLRFRAPKKGDFDFDEIIRMVKGYL